MIVKFRCISVQKSDKGEVILDLKDNVNSLINLLKILSNKVDIDFVKNINSYMFMVNDSVINDKDFDSSIITNSDTLTIFPMIDGG